MEKRRSKRTPRRWSVRFGETDLSWSGFTRDVSPEGAFIATSHLPPIGSRVHVQLLIGAGQCAFLEAVVRRHQIVPPALRQLLPSGIGVAFLSPREILGALNPATPRLEVRFPDAARLRETWAGGLRLGTLRLPGARALAQGAAVLVGLHLEFARRTFEFAAHVVAPAGPDGTLGLSFAEPDLVTAALAPFAG